MWRHCALLIAFSSLILFCRLGTTRLWDQDEPRNAGCAAEMLDRGDYVTPVFNGQLRGHKPVLLYWLMMASYSVLGRGELAARAGSALCAIGTVLCTYGIGRRLFDARSALWSGMILSSCLMFVVAGRAATPDALLIFCCTLSMYAFVRKQRPCELATDADETHAAARRMATPIDWRTAALMYGSMGLGVLAKGPIGFVLPVGVVGLYLTLCAAPAANVGWSALLRSAARRVLQAAWNLRPLTALLMLLVVAAPWYAWVGWRTNGAWLREFFIEHNWHRARRAMEGHHGPPFYYLLAILPGFFPWSIFIVPTALDAWRQWRRRESAAPAILFCCCWIVTWVGAFSLARTKLPSYITPCYPALALLTAHYVCRWSAKRAAVSERWPWWSLASMASAGVALGIALPVVASRLLPGEQWLGLLGLYLIGTAAAAAWLLARQQRMGTLRVLAASACAWLILLFAWAAPRVDRHQHVDTLLQVIRGRQATLPVLCYGGLQPSWVYYTDRHLDELAASVSGPEADANLNGYLRQHPDALLITTRRQWVQWQQARTKQGLSSPARVLADVPYFLKSERLVLLQVSGESVVR